MSSSAFAVVLIAFILISNGLVINSQGLLKDSWSCRDRIDEALIEFTVTSVANVPANQVINVLYQYTECERCNLVTKAKLNTANNYASESTIDTFYNYYFKVQYDNNQVICDTFEYKGFKECGIYSFNIDVINNVCTISVLQQPLSFNSNNYIYIGIAIAFIMTLVANAIIIGYRKLRETLSRRKAEKKEVKRITTVYQRYFPFAPPSSELEDKTVTKEPPKRKPFLSLDTFKGLSVVFILFVSYGAGGYKQLGNRPWHGMNFASFLFPWFLFCAGAGIPISFDSFLEKQKLKRYEVLFKVVATFLKKFIIGLMLGSLAGTWPETLRIMGILQRVATTYLIVGLIELVFYKPITSEVTEKRFFLRWLDYFQDITHAWLQWICMLIIVALWLFLTFLLKPPNCPRGYFGPGGLHDGGKYEHCLGGAARYIDNRILGDRHMLVQPALKKIYNSSMTFEPEGILSTLTACFTVFLGVVAGRIFLFYDSHFVRIRLWATWALICFSLFGVLSFFKYNGPIPVNAHLWTLTYVFLVGATSFAILIFFYVLTDLLKVWDGAPFMYIGINPILIYILFSIFIAAFPIQWKVHNNHPSLFYMHFYGCFFWTLFAGYLFHENMVLIL